MKKNVIKKNMIRNDIIAFGGRKRVGKGELSKIYIEKGYKKITIANYLKKLCASILNVDIDTLNNYKDNGTTFKHVITNDNIELISYNSNIPSDIIHEELYNFVFTNVRDMLQIIGTDIIRKYNPDWHINKMKEEILNSNTNKFVVDDLRFPNEKKAIESLGGICYYIIRPKSMIISNHPSETALTFHDFPETNVIVNDTTVEELIFKFKANIFENKKIDLFLSDYPQYTEYKNVGTDQATAELIIKNMKEKNDYHYTFNNEIIYGEILWYNPCIIENIKQYIKE